ncbi:hypothetical protein MBANPS3_007320 [Mucor bainieri]
MGPESNNSRFISGCGLLLGNVYCYGGLIYTSKTETKATDVMSVLDITNKSGTASADLEALWKTVSFIRNDLDLTPRSDPQCVIMDDQYHMVINGGYSSTSAQLKDLNVMYNARQNKWYAHSAYSESPYGYRQIYWGSGSYVPGKGAAFYGGFEEFTNPNWTTPNVNASIFAFSNGASRSIGFPQVNYFNIDNPSSTWIRSLPLTTAVDDFSAGHQSVFDPVTNMLLFMGGEYRTTTSPNPIPRPYSYIKAFNTFTNKWSMMNLTGDIPTSGRTYSTLTLLPSTGRHVLLYGGQANNAVVQDYCNVLNLDTKNWTRQTIVAPAGTTLERSKHSAVLVNNNTLFVMWGMDRTKVGLSSVLILNTTNPDAITMSSKYVDPNDPNAAKDSNGNTAKPGDDDVGDSTGLSSGAKAGIAVAAAVAVIMGALAVWFYFRNKKKNERIRNQEHELAKQQQQAEYYNNNTTAGVEPMEVDWDQIETKYTEVPANKVATVSSVRDSTPSTTVISGGDPNSTAYAAAAVHPDAVEAQRPNAMNLAPQPPRVLKPDGGY